MTKICFLHLGFHKTATTSIQLTCRNNSNLLRKNGIETPRFFNEKNKISANHTQKLRDIFSPLTKNYTIRSNMINVSQIKVVPWKVPFLNL